MLLSTRRERRLEGLLIAASVVGLALLANHCVPDVKIVDPDPDAGLGGAGGAAGQAGAVNTGGTETGTPGLIGGPCLEGLEGELCTVGRCNPSNSRCITGEYGDPCQEDGHCVGGHCELQSAGGAGGAGGATTGVCGKYPALTAGCSDNEQCITDECRVNVCVLGIDGSACYTDDDCDLGYCFEGTCRLLPAGEDCDPDRGGNAECLSGDCHWILRTCQLGAGDTPCTTDSDCMTGSCAGESTEATCVAPVVFAQTRRVEFDFQGDEYLDVEFRLLLGGQGPVPLSELAFIYFYYKATSRPQALVDIPTTGNLTADEILISMVEPSGGWRMASVQFATDVELTEAAPDTGDLYFRIDTPILPPPDNRYDQVVDFSWPDQVPDAEFGTDFNENTRTVICRNVDGAWRREFGNSPPQIPDPCGWL